MIDPWVFLYTFLYFCCCILAILYQLDFLFCNSAFEQGHLDTWRYKNALIIIIIIIHVLWVHLSLQNLLML